MMNMHHFDAFDRHNPGELCSRTLQRLFAWIGNANLIAFNPIHGKGIREKAALGKDDDVMPIGTQLAR